MFIIPCQKRRHTVRTERDGSKREFYKCAHRASTTYRKEVDETACEHCALTQTLLSGNSCGMKPPAEAKFPQPVLGDDAEVTYQPGGAVPPPCPDGYQRRDDKPWIFDSIWRECPYRVFNNDLHPDGSLKVRAYCALANKPITFGGCEECQESIEDIDGSLDVPENPAAIKFVDQMRTYLDAVRNWIAKGRPTRTKEEVKRLHDNYCSRCDWYDPMGERCKGCGCKVRSAGVAMLNKIKMSTEHCPRDFW